MAQERRHAHTARSEASPTAMAEEAEYLIDSGPLGVPQPALEGRALIGALVARARELLLREGELQRQLLLRDLHSIVPCTQ